MFKCLIHVNNHPELQSIHDIICYSAVTCTAMQGVDCRQPGLQVMDLNS